jgi:hypothetical protein
VTESESNPKIAGEPVLGDTAEGRSQIEVLIRGHRLSPSAWPFTESALGRSVAPRQSLSHKTSRGQAHHARNTGLQGFPLCGDHSGWRRAYAHVTWAPLTRQKPKSCQERRLSGRCTRRAFSWKSEPRRELKQTDVGVREQKAAITNQAARSNSNPGE